MAEMAPSLWADRDQGPYLSGVRCRDCTMEFFPPQHYGCENCGAEGDRLEICELAASGRLIGFAIVHQHSKAETPFQIAEVVLDAGPVVRARLDHEAPVIGERVVGATEPFADGVELVFIPGVDRA